MQLFCYFSRVVCPTDFFVCVCLHHAAFALVSLRLILEALIVHAEEDDTEYFRILAPLIASTFVASSVVDDGRIVIVGGGVACLDRALLEIADERVWGEDGWFK